jgi:hypothetical protein
MREYLQAHQAKWPYVVCGVIPGVSKPSSASVPPKRRGSKGKTKSKKTGTCDDDGLEAALTAVSAVKAAAQEKVAALRKQRELADRVSLVASQLQLSESTLFDIARSRGGGV